MVVTFDGSHAVGSDGDAVRGGCPPGVSRSHGVPARRALRSSGARTDGGHGADARESVNLNVTGGGATRGRHMVGHDGFAAAESHSGCDGQDGCDDAFHVFLSVSSPRT